ncbi:Zn-ribbon domain-containing OB-fold protein [Candidatus Litorirhabdus singularis]|nr:OB-fold domain-containing protein [Candidatus Litorirhabdus singularis]
MNAEIPSRVQPTPNAVSAPYWEACARGELSLQHCNGCQQFQFYPRTICSHCGGTDLAWQVVSGSGRVKSFTVVRRGISKAYAAPYVVALIELKEGPSMMSTIVGSEPEVVAIGASVQVGFEAWSEDIQMPVFSLT